MDEVKTDMNISDGEKKDRRVVVSVVAVVVVILVFVAFIIFKARKERLKRLFYQPPSENEYEQQQV